MLDEGPWRSSAVPRICCAAADDDAFSACESLRATSIASAWVEDAHRLSDRSAVPPELDVAHPSGGAVPAGRGARRDQLLNVFLFVAPFLRRKPDAVVVDFGCGGGLESLPLAYRLPRRAFRPRRREATLPWTSPGAARTPPWPRQRSRRRGG